MNTAVMTIVSQICGWIYFTAWSLSFYPQLILNHRRQSVVGLSLNYVVLNITGFTAYALYNVLLASYEPARKRFTDVNAGFPPQIALNDVVFAVHGSALCVVAVIECLTYPRGSQTVQKGTALGCALAWVCLVGGLMFSFAGLLDWIYFIRLCGVVKLLGSFFKYLPQVAHNHTRKSTEGFSWSAIALDFTGGVFSIAQQLITSYLVNSWMPFSKNVAKTFLALETLFFDSILLTQHFVVYRPPESSFTLVGAGDVEVQNSVYCDMEEFNDDDENDGFLDERLNSTVNLLYPASLKSDNYITYNTNNPSLSSVRGRTTSLGETCKSAATLPER